MAGCSEPPENGVGAYLCNAGAVAARAIIKRPLPDRQDEFQEVSRTDRKGLGEVVVARELLDP